MKKALSILLTIVIAVSFVACGNNNKKAWAIEQTRDEFGDVTANSSNCITATFDGTFSNTATMDSKLKVGVIFAQTVYGHYIGQFTLYEYEKTKATYYDTDTIALKVKAGEEEESVYEYTLKGEAPNGSLYLESEYPNYDADNFFNMLFKGLDLRCIIEIGSSKYSFTIASSNLKELCEENKYSAGPCELTLREIVASYLKDEGIIDWETSRNMVINRLPDMKRLNSAQISEEIKGEFVHIRLGAYTPVNDETGRKINYPWMDSYIFEKKGFTNAAEWNLYYKWYLAAISKGLSNAEAKRREYDPVRDPVLCSIKVENDMIIMTNPVAKITTSYMFYKLSNNIYIMAKYDEESKKPSAPDILVKSNASMEDTLKNVYESDIMSVKL